MLASLYLLCRNRCMYTESTANMPWKHLFSGVLYTIKKSNVWFYFFLILRFSKRTVPKPYLEVGRTEYWQSSSQPIYSCRIEKWTLWFKLLSFIYNKVTISEMHTIKWNYLMDSAISNTYYKYNSLRTKQVLKQRI